MTSALTKKNIAAIVMGNALEWYDFVVYSFMTVVIAKLFFPAVHMANSILATTATFGVAFCMRPLGGVLLGVYSDRRGRKAAITLVIGMMALAMLIITVAPTYQQAGVLAPIMMVVARLLQGFSAGGEFGVSTALLMELAPKNQRGYYCSWQMVGQMIAMFLGAALGILITDYFTIEQVYAFAWRIPFALGLIIAPVGIYIRSHLTETNKAVAKPNNPSARPLFFLLQLKKYYRQVLITMGLVIGGTVAIYVNISYMPTYVAVYLNQPIEHAFIAIGVAILLMITLIPFFGGLSDSIGRKPVLLTSVSLYLILIYPLFHWLVEYPYLPVLMTVEIVCCLLLSAFFGVFAVIVAELFPLELRSSGLGVSYNIAVMLFGGFAQFIVTWLIVKSGKPIAITYYLLSAVIICLVAALFYSEEKGAK